MFRALRRNINPATILALVALVFAATGGAYAATSGSGGGGVSHVTLSASAAAKKAKPKSTRGPAGPKGATGATGATGPAGPAGPAGAAGAKGETGPAGTVTPGTDGTNGTPGANGTDGVNGKSVVTETLQPEQGGCKEGGLSVEIEHTGIKKSVCNGENGSGGSGGEFPNYLPEGKTETGTWSFVPEEDEVENEEGKKELRKYVAIPVSFTIPLKEKPTVSYLLGPAESNEHCKGSAAKPSAEPGYACLYTTFALGEEAETILANNPEHERHHSFPSGNGVVFYASTESPSWAFGTWAVTAPEEKA